MSDRKNWDAPDNIREAREIATTNIAGALDFAGAAYRSAKHGTRVQLYHNLALAYEQVVRFTKDKSLLREFVAATDPQQQWRKVKPDLAMRLCVRRAEQAKTAEAKKLADKHARALCELYKKRTPPSRVVLRLRETTMSALASQHANRRAKRSNDKKAAPCVHLRLKLSKADIEATMAGTGSAKIIVRIKKEPDGKYVVSKLQLRPITEK